MTTGRTPRKQQSNLLSWTRQAVPCEQQSPRQILNCEICVAQNYYGCKLTKPEEIWLKVGNFTWLVGLYRCLLKNHCIVWDGESENIVFRIKAAKFTNHSNVQMFFSGQALDCIRPSSRWMVMTAIRWNLSLCPCVSDHLQNIPHRRPVLWCEWDTGHCNAYKNLNFLLRRLITGGRVISGLGLLLAYWSHPPGNIWTMLLNKVLERSLSSQKFQQENAEAVDISWLGGWFSYVSDFRGSVEERGGVVFLRRVWISERGQTIVRKAGLEFRAKKDIRGFQIPMGWPGVLVDIKQSSCQVLCYFQARSPVKRLSVAGSSSSCTRIQKLSMQYIYIPREIP